MKIVLFQTLNRDRHIKDIKKLFLKINFCKNTYRKL